MPISIIHPRLARADSLATWMLPLGPKRKLAKIKAASTVPKIPAREPSIAAVKSRTAVKIRGTMFFHTWPLAAALKPTAASAQTSPPMAASMRGMVQSFPAAVFTTDLLMNSITCMIFVFKHRMTKVRVAVGKIESCLVFF